MNYPASAKFLGRTFEAPSGVLFPHVATEFLALAAIAHLSALPEPPALAWELGAGTGVLGISLLQAFPGLTMRASDVSLLALDTAKRNAGQELQHRLSLLHARTTDVLEPFLSIDGGTQPLDFFISNPPYLLQSDEISAFYRDNMPREALYAPDDRGVQLYERLAAGLARELRSGGAVFLEARAQRAQLAAAQLRRHGFLTEVFDKFALCDRYAILHPNPDARARRLANHAYIIAERPR